MRKSLGSKRKYLTEKHIEEIVKIYGSFRKNKISKIFKTTEFGYRRITVERPLKLSFKPQEEIRTSALKEESMFQKFSKKEQEAIFTALAELKTAYNDRTKFLEDLNSSKALEKAKIKLSSAQEKMFVKVFGEQDDSAAVCRNAKGEIEPDSDLRDSENVPLNEDIESYFAREVLPHVPDAWIDREKKDEKDGKVGIVGYEIPFNRHFYEYRPPRDLKEIDKDLDKVTKEILELLQEVHS